MNTKNKLLFTLERNFNETIKLVADNRKDLEDYLHSKYNWHKIAVSDDLVRIIEREGYDTVYATLEWVLCI
jgi:hypothetical protein